MLITLPQVNVPKCAISVPRVATVYVRQYGAGNLRLAGTREELQNPIAPGGVVDGIPQAAAQGIQQYFWSGDLWLVSDNAGDVVMIYAPALQFLLNRGIGLRQPSDVEVDFATNDMSTW